MPRTRPEVAGPPLRRRQPARRPRTLRDRQPPVHRRARPPVVRARRRPSCGSLRRSGTRCQGRSSRRRSNVPGRVSLPR
ncbi:hypothetical protein EFY87_10680 [Flexivirga caeni]|uniref:Uncharacterized protein n=1 Tax=Flexivirga caeni TaxID=2294115 RepID=A0A3M9M7S0_9MICO|nr:hypothetical protein EFY87_10680 [Flexivirga caeni]